MNAERLHAIARELKGELDETQQAPLMQALLQGLRAMSQQAPGQPGPQQQVSETRQDLASRLQAAPSNRYSPVQRQELTELGVEHLFGDALLATIEEIFVRNEITPTAAAEVLENLATHVDRLETALDQLLQSFEFFGIGSEELGPGEFEISFVIPRDAVGNAVGELGEELRRINRILGPFLELATGSRPEVEVRAIGSSDFQVLLYGVPSAALMFSKAIDYLVSAYQKVIEIREGRQRLADAGVSKKTLDEIGREADQRMNKEIELLVEQLLADCEVAPDRDRRNELKKELRDSLRALALRIDRGYVMEARAGELPPPPEEDDEEPDPEEERIRPIVEAVVERQERLRYTNLSGQPILELPESVDEPEVPDHPDRDQPPN